MLLLMFFVWANSRRGETVSVEERKLTGQKSIPFIEEILTTNRTFII